MKRLSKRLKATLTGALVCSLLGPILGALAIVASEVHSAVDAVSAFAVLPWVLPIAVMLVGPGAFVLGGVGGFFAQSMSARVRTNKNLVLQTTGVGLLLGGAVPALADFILTELWGGWNKNFATGLLPLGAITGLICAAATFWLLQRMHLLDFQQSCNSKLV